MSLFLSGVLPRHTLNAPLLWRVLRGVLGGASLQSVAQGLPKLPMALESLRGACRRLRRRLDAVRTVLCGAQAPPLSFIKRFEQGICQDETDTGSSPTCADKQSAERFAR